MAPITGVDLGLLVGFIPTASMTLASILLSSISVHSLVEASVQNFAAGLILAAVAAELFPLMIGEDVTTTDSMIGVTVGFAVGLTILNSVESVVGYIISFVEKEPEEGSAHSQSRRSSDAGRKKTDIPFNEVDEPELTMELKAIKKARKPRSGSGSDNGLLIADDIADEGEWEDEPIHMSHVALSVPSHRQHLEEHMREMYDCVVDMENKAIHLLSENSLSQKDVERVAEEIDEAVHNLHYKLDHCKRLLQGSEIEIHMTATTGAKDAVIVPLNTAGSWVTEAKKHRIKGRLAGLKATVQHLVDHILEENIDKRTLTEMHEHMEHMESQLTMFHDTVEKAAAKWRRCRPTTMPLTELGDKIPIDLVIPVTMDCFIDGFLIGVTCAIAPTAGIILGAANCLEMGFLGMAYATRISRCTGSSKFVRFLVLYCPPLLMFVSSGFGAFIADKAANIPAIFVGFVAFGCVALLALVCNELIIEAKEAQGEDEKWWVNLFIFAGVYLVLMTSRVM